MDSVIDYHLKELEIASDPNNPKHTMPEVLDSDESILDIGCGIGQTLVRIKSPEKRTLVGIDIDLTSLQYGNSHFENNLYLCSSAEKLPFKTETFDLVISRVTLPYTRINETIRDISRILKKNGRIWLVLHPCSMTFRHFISAIKQFHIKDTCYQIYVFCNGAALHFLGKEFCFPILNTFESFQTKSRMKKILTKCGFDNIKSETGHDFIINAIKRTNKLL